MKKYWIVTVILTIVLVGVFGGGIYLLRGAAEDLKQDSSASMDAAPNADSEEEDQFEEQPQSGLEPQPEEGNEVQPEEDEEAQALQVYIDETSAEAKQLALRYDYDAALALLDTEQALACEPLQELRKQLEQEKSELVRWPDTTTVPHIFFHSLIVDPALAFDGDYDADGYNLYMATVAEFEEILQQMYDRGYVLVNIYDVAKPETQEDGSVRYVQGDILLPPGKKPFVLSQDDTNYYEYMQGDGFATRLVALPDGSLSSEYRTADGETLTGDYDLAPILERFVSEHPDFSYRGARAIIGVTGYEGVYGYKTHPKYEQELGAEAYAAEVEAANAVTEALKAHGSVIASHSFGHPAYGQISVESLREDVQKWEQQVQPITGECDILLYPYGNDISGVEGYSGEKFQILYDAGYRYFCNVDGGHDYWVQIHDGYVRQGRRNIDGYRLYHGPKLLDDLFDPASVIDLARPLPVPEI